MNTSTTETLQLYCPQTLAEHLGPFQQAYWLKWISICIDTRKTSLKRNLRTCRFCKKQSPAVTFRKKAHIFPKAMGNSHFLSDEECDACNALFSDYENHLAKFMGLTRSLNGAADKSRIPVFVSPDQMLTAFATPFYGTRAIKIETAPNEDNPAMQIDLEKGTTSFTYEKLPYIPQYVFKSLLKMLLSTLPPEELVNYSRLLPYLQAKQLPVPTSPVAVFTLPVGHRVTPPYALIFEKRDANSVLPYHVCMVRLEHFVFEFILPGHLHWSPNTENISVPMCPPLAFYPQFVDAKVVAAFVELSSMEQKLEKGSLGLKLETINKADLKALDPITGKEVERVYDPSDITGIIIVHDKDFRIPSKG